MSEAARRSKAYRERHPERVKAAAARYRMDNPEKTAASHKKWADSNVEKIKKARQAWAENNQDKLRSNRLKHAYGITLKEYEDLLEAQGGVCAGCGSDPGDKNLHVDHDHKCCEGARSCGSCIRGLLCGPCNRALGFLSDDPVRLARLARYAMRCGVLGL